MLTFDKAYNICLIMVGLKFKANGIGCYFIDFQ